MLTIPYKTVTKVYDNEQTEKFKLVESVEYAHFLPEKLAVSGDIKPEVRYRGIYEVIVYNSKINLKGSFSTPSFENWKIDSADILWDDASVSLGLTDLRSIQEDISIHLNNKNYSFNPGLESNDVMQSGMSTKLNLKN